MPTIIAMRAISWGDLETLTVRRSGPVAWAMLIEPVYRGYRIEVQAELVDGAGTRPFVSAECCRTIRRTLNG
jgi:hypothetical protein